MNRTWGVMPRFVAGIGLTCLALSALGQKADDLLERGFKEPPESARPRVWWHWMNGNVTKEGITLDLEWMKRVGIGGIQMFDANIGNILAGELTVRQYVDRRIVFHTPEWKEMLRHAAAECDRLGLEMTMHLSGGWSETGGPWVKPEQAMKKLVWSETEVQGPQTFTGTLPPPPSVNGPFQNLTQRSFRDLLIGAGGAPPSPPHYGDSAVIAYRLPDEAARMRDLRPKVTSSSRDFDAAALMDGDLARTVTLPAPEGGGPAWIQFEFAQPFRASAFSIAVRGGGLPFGGAGIPNGQVTASEDGTTFVPLATLPGPGNNSAPVRTYSFPEITARFYRVEFTSATRGAFEEFLRTPPPRQYDLAEMEFHSEARVNRWEDKAGFGILFEYDSVRTPGVPTGAAIARDSVVDLTARMDKEGRLQWDVPAGRWVILRMGYSLTGAQNAPAPPEATGYEADKLSRKHMEAYLHGFVDPVSEALGPLFGKSFRYFLMDSWEAGLQNWTEEMRAEFRARRGYDPTPYLPVLTGRVVESAEVSDRFLWDFRRTLADMVADYHYRFPVEFLRERGIQVYGEAAGANNPMFQDALLNKGRVDIPMGEFWQIAPGATHRPEHLMDIREAASAAHIYGKPLVAAESFTSFVPGWNDPPSSLKWLGDYYMALGVNRFVIHTSVHQPFVDRKPGFTLGPFGQHFTRHNTWAEQSGGWLSCLSRSCYLLQQGLFVGDIAYYYGESVPATTYQGEKTTPEPEPPPGYAYDYVNTEVLLTRMTVKDGRLMLPDGMSYRLLVLPNHLDRLTPPVLRKIRDLIAEGAVVVGPKPTKSPSLVGYPACDAEIRAIANEVWGAVDGRTVLERAYGKGRVYWGKPLSEVLSALNTPPDFEYNRPKIDTTLVSIHRRLGDTDIYFVANQQDRPEEVEARFRVEGKAAELWHPETGEIGPAAYTIEKGRTTVPLRLGPHESVFVVFRQAATAPSRVLPRPVSAELATLKGPWSVAFPPNWGAPPSIHLNDLISWTMHTDPGVKYFSGTATYVKEIEAPRGWFQRGAKLVLDLGRVKEIAEVAVNGRPLGILWRPPFQADVSQALKPGKNRLEIRITNLWANRMIGDAQPSETKRYTFSIFQPYNKDSPLLESGLLGPVRLIRMKNP